MKTKEKTIIKLDVRDKLKLKGTGIDEKAINNLAQSISTDEKPNVEIKREKGILNIRLENVGKYIIWEKDTKKGEQDIGLVNENERIRVFNKEGTTEIFLHFEKVEVEATISKKLEVMNTFKKLVDITRKYEEGSEICNVASYLQENLGDISFLEIYKKGEYNLPIEKALYKNMDLESVSDIEYIIHNGIMLCKEVKYDEEELLIEYFNNLEDSKVASILVDADWVRFEILKEAETDEWYKLFRKIHRNLINDFEYSKDSFIKGAVKRKILEGRLRNLISEEEYKLTSLFEKQKISQ